MRRIPTFEVSVRVGATVGAAFLVVPLLALAIRAPWAMAIDLLVDEMVVTALLVSFSVSLAAVAIAALLGMPVAWVLARHQFPGSRLVRTLVTLPMVLPPVVAGVGLLQAFGRRGLLGPALESIGVRLPFSLAGAVLAASFVSMPFLIVTVEGALRSQGDELEQAAASLGATPGYRARKVVLPGIKASIGAGLALSWARALGEFGATITFAGNLPGETQTMPLAVYLELQGRPDAAILLSLILLVIAVVVLMISRRVSVPT